MSEDELRTLLDELRTLLGDALFALANANLEPELQERIREALKAEAPPPDMDWSGLTW